MLQYLLFLIGANTVKVYRNCFAFIESILYVAHCEQFLLPVM